MKHILLSSGSKTTVVNLKPVIDDLGLEVKNRLQNGIAHFIFMKVDGSTREAFGTTNAELLVKLVGPAPEKDKQKAPAKGTNPESDNIIYYDFDAKAFRSFKLSTVVAVL